ncbi:MAG TPA: TlpA disulfide reductase family protein [Gemmatimonadales bacterium]|jgi:cytochrome c biogenesis protein CcmG/thiol:disulfide interchange protein DsbE
MIPWRRVAWPLAGLPVLALLAFGLTRDARRVDSPLPGRLAPDFVLETLDGDSVHLTALRGKVVLVNFWASWCLACVAEHDVLVAAQRRWGPEGFQVLGVVYQDTRPNARQWMTERGGDWPTLFDPGSRMAIEYGLFGVPESFLVDRAGRIAFKQIGPVSGDALARMVPPLLAGQTTSETVEHRSPGHVRSSPEFPTAGGERREP